MSHRQTNFVVFRVWNTQRVSQAACCCTRIPRLRALIRFPFVGHKYSCGPAWFTVAYCYPCPMGYRGVARLSSCFRGGTYTFVLCTSALFLDLCVTLSSSQQHLTIYFAQVQYPRELQRSTSFLLTP